MSRPAGDGPRGSITSAIFWMFLLSLLLFWMPVLGPGIAGLVGGRKAGGVGAALVAVFLPAILIGCALFLAGSLLSGLPLIGAVAGIGGMAVALAHIGPMLVGAIVGGAMA